MRRRFLNHKISKGVFATSRKREPIGVDRSGLRSLLERLKNGEPD
jgi:hypothetical protein